MVRVREGRCGAGVIALAATIIQTGCGTAPRQRLSPGEPQSAAEVARDLREGEARFEHKRVRAATCRQTSGGHWRCSVRLSDRTTGTVLAVWYGRERTLGFTLLPRTGVGR